MKLFLVKLKEEHCVTEFNNIDGILYKAKNFKEVLEKLSDYIEYMVNETELSSIEFTIEKLGFINSLRKFKINLNEKRKINE